METVSLKGDCGMSHKTRFLFVAITYINETNADSERTVRYLNRGMFFCDIMRN